MATVNAGARLDRLPISSFHRRIMWLIGAGMFFDGFDLYLLGPVLGAMISTKFAVPAQAPLFVSATFIGMTLGALLTGFVGDRFGRRFTYQTNLALFGVASLAGAFSTDMNMLIAWRFIMGVGLGAEIVVGYGTLPEFVPPKTRGRWLGCMALIVVAGFPVTAIVSNFLIPSFGWRAMFAIAGIGALVVWYLRKALPESPRWLESQGRVDEAEALMREIEQEASGGQPLPPPALPPPVLVILAGLGLIVPTYILTAILYGVYTAEIFPTEVRLRANGICNFFGRGVTVISPFIIFPVFKDYGVQGVLALMIGLLVIQIVVVALWGVETRQRALEQVAPGEADAAAKPRTAAA